MRFEKFYLSETNKNITLDCYLYEPVGELPTLNTRPAVVVCPGGGYYICSNREADPIAMSYLSAGYHTFLLRYSIEEEAVYPNSLVDLCHAMKIIRDHAEEWGVKKDEIAVCGFSAGGHLAASLGVHYTEERIQKASGCAVEEIKPNALILVYPVISTSWMENSGHLARIIGDGDYEQTYKDLNLHTCVNKDTPPSFLAQPPLMRTKFPLNYTSSPTVDTEWGLQTILPPVADTTLPSQSGWDCHSVGLTAFSESLKRQTQRL